VDSSPSAPTARQSTDAPQPSAGTTSPAQSESADPATANGLSLRERALELDRRVGILASEIYNPLYCLCSHPTVNPNPGQITAWLALAEQIQRNTDSLIAVLSQMLAEADR
jgi:hypothetical protein